MLRRVFALAGLAAALVWTGLGAADKKDIETSKKALAELGEFVGEWKSNGEMSEGKKSLWKETTAWGWKFGKDGEAWLAIESKDSKLFTNGALKYVPAKKVYQLTATDKAGTELVYEGKLVKGKLELTRADKATGDVHKLTVHTLADGARMIVQQQVQAKGKGLFSDQFKTAGTKEGESFAGGGKKNECVVTGGLGTMQVSYNGKTYFVCCSGCREEFNLNPKKYVDEFEKNKKK